MGPEGSVLQRGGNLDNERRKIVGFVAHRRHNGYARNFVVLQNAMSF
jgi:hypothetical protein